MRKYLLPKNGNYYKANLHCHTICSDGKMTPEDIKRAYTERGYSIVAYTDHDVFITHNELKDDNFLPLNGYELSFKGDKVCHICAISLDEELKTQKIFYKSVFEEKNFGKLHYDSNGEYLERQYSPEFISKTTNTLRNDNFFVTYNHPVWSMETCDEYCNYHGIHAMEIVNYGCVIEGYSDRNGNIYDQILRGNKKIFCIATDDNHNIYPFEHPKSDSFGGFTMIKAEKLEYEVISQALLNGHFYASEGPEIKELYFEDGKIHIKSSEATRIIMTTCLRHYRTATADKKGEVISEAIFNIVPELTGEYVRFTVVDKDGKEAHTNAYFLSDFFSE